MMKMMMEEWSRRCDDDVVFDAFVFVMMHGEIMDELMMMMMMMMLFCCSNLKWRYNISTF